MISLLETYQELLLEFADRRKVMDAISNRNITTIYYAGDKTIAKGYRDIEPVCLGTSKRNNMVLRAWQREGSSDTPENLPGWRLFRLDGIKYFQTRDEQFNEIRPGYNLKGDRDMIRIYKMTIFN
jgi:predicted DNA-binding transcriptional regulator YafY